MRNFIMICAINFCLYFSSYLTMISGTNYAKIALNATTSTAGLVVLLYTLGLILSTLIFGNFIDRLNLKRAIFITMGLDLIVTCLYLVAESIGFLLLLRVATGLLFGVGTLICNTTISKIIPEEKKGVGIGYYNMSVIVASAISPFIAIKLNVNLMFKESFLVATIAFVISVVAIFLLNLKDVKLNSQNQTKNLLNFRNFIDIRSLPIATIMLIAGFSYGGILAFLSLYTKELDLNFAGSIYYPFYSVVALCAVWMSGKIFDFKRENFITTLTLISFFISLILLSFAKNSIYILSSAFFLAFGWASFKSLAQTITIKLTTKDKIGLANSTFFIAANLGIGISPYVLGFFEPKFGFSGVYTISAFVILAGAGFYYLLVWRFFR